MGIILAWLVFSIVAGIIANARGRSGFGYFLLSLILSPVIGILLAACLPSRVYIDTNGVMRRVTRPAREPMVEPSESFKRAEFLIALAIVVAIAAICAMYIVSGNFTYMANP